MARRKHPDFRELDGILLFDKPKGLSSNQALQQVRRLFGAEKGGHTGSLDPLATGLLPMCFGEATKIAGLLLAESKAYETVARFGVETDTADADGEVIARKPVATIDDLAIDAALRSFIGSIRQIPPIYSALKQGGEPLYLKARRGEHVEVEAREVRIDAIERLERGPDWVRLRVECGSGTYIRSLVRDLGAALGCGAHVEELRRLWAEPFRAPRMVTLEQLQVVAAQGRDALDALLLPIEAGLAHTPQLVLDPDQALRLGQGQVLPWPTSLPAGGYAAMSQDGRALALVELQADGGLRPRRLLRWAAIGASEAR
jgi:tRNA pseudouridine55 synthase